VLLGSGPTLQGSSRDRNPLPRIPNLAPARKDSTLPMIPRADANLAYQVGAVPDIDG
jgi:hypothetical protein